MSSVWLTDISLAPGGSSSLMVRPQEGTITHMGQIRLVDDNHNT